LGHLKDALRGRRFADEDKLKHSVHKELRHFNRELYTIGRQRLTQKWKSVLVMKETLWENNLNIFEGCDHDISKFHFDRNKEALPSYRPYIYYNDSLFTTLVESDRALPTSGASLSQLKRPFCT
jgi:hypothetical protein